MSCTGGDAGGVGGGRKLGNHPLPPLGRMAGTKRERPRQRLQGGGEGVHREHPGGTLGEGVSENLHRAHPPRHTPPCSRSVPYRSNFLSRGPKHRVPPDRKQPNPWPALSRDPSGESAQRRRRGSRRRLPQPPPHSLTVPTHRVPPLSRPSLRPILAPRKQAGRPGSAARVPGIEGHPKDRGREGQGFQSPPCWPALCSGRSAPV